MFLSMIIPVYNTEKYLAECLDSCLDQDIPYSDYEIICVNDGSTDRSAAILAEYAEKHENIVIITQENAGVSAARNAGMERATGEWIWFIDSDDLIRKCFLRDVKNHIILSPANRNNIIRFQCYWFETCSSIVPEKIDVTKADTRITGLWQNLFRADLCRNIKFDERIAYGEDIIWLRKYYLYNNVISSEINSIGYFYRQNDTSAMHRTGTQSKKMYSNIYGAFEMEKVYNAPGGACEANANILMNHINTALILIAKSNDVEALRMMKESGLYPFKKPKYCTTKKAYTTTRTDLIGKFYNWMCVNAHTRIGFTLLCLWCKLHKIVSSLKQAGATNE